MPRTNQGPVQVVNNGGRDRTQPRASNATSSNASSRASSNNNRSANDNTTMGACYCPFCCSQLLYPEGSAFIQCPQCKNTMNPQVFHQSHCVRCRQLLSFPPNSLHIQCPQCKAVQNARDKPCVKPKPHCAASAQGELEEAFVADSSALTIECLVGEDELHIGKRRRTSQDGSSDHPEFGISPQEQKERDMLHQIEYTTRPPPDLCCSICLAPFVTPVQVGTLLCSSLFGFLLVKGMP